MPPQLPARQPGGSGPVPPISVLQPAASTCSASKSTRAIRGAAYGRRDAPFGCELCSSDCDILDLSLTFKQSAALRTQTANVLRGL